MKTNQTKATISKKRWAAYAASGAAAVVTGAQTAEADITHIVLNDGAGTSMGVGGSEYFELVGNAAIHLFNTFVSSTNSQQYAGVFGAVFNNSNFYGDLAGFKTNFYPYASNMAVDASVQTAPFLPTSSFGTLAYGAGDKPNTQFNNAGDGYLGFSFSDSGLGTQYGWMRVTMNGGPSNTLTVQEYAFAGVGETIKVGEIDAIPEPSSLGLLALGAAGVLANRRRKNRNR